MRYQHGFVTKSLVGVFVIVGLIVAGVVLAQQGREETSYTFDKAQQQSSENTPGDIIDEEMPENNIIEDDLTEEATPIIIEEPVIEPIRLETPEQVKAVYMTSWVAGTASVRERVLRLVEDTEINALVIDIKDSTGKVAFRVDNELINSYDVTENRIPNIREFIRSLNERGIYVIGRISVFQDPYLAERHPELAVRTNTDGGVWKDHKGLSFLDVTNETVWNYITELALESYDVGFDEINFDYIRYPSDGDMSTIEYNLDQEYTRADNVEKFFKHIDKEVRQKGIPTSADLFGMTTTHTKDLNIGQILEKTLPYFDYVAPMVYPSHYPKGWRGYAKPATEPYNIVHTAMKGGVERAEAMGYSGDRLRTWIQDFNLGATYTADMVRAQIQASYDAGVDSWMVWDAANTYTRDAYLVE